MKKGFTLAEVLITLAIIGVVAALTIPAVVRNYQERQTVSALKKFYSQISQAFKMAEIQNGPVDTWDWGADDNNGENAARIFELVIPHLKVMKNCGTKSGCLPVGGYKTLSGADWQFGDSYSGWAKVQLSDGMFVLLNSYGANCSTNRNRTGRTNKQLLNVCGHISADINGAKAPNQMGRDLFRFWVTKYGVVPIGMPDDDYTLNTYCNKTVTQYYTGYSCAAWVLAKENMDYLHKDISW